VVGLKMAMLSMRSENDIPGFISGFTGTQRYIMDYLIEEVLQRQSPEVRDFLLKTSVLERLNGPLCDAITGRCDGQETLISLEKANLRKILKIIESEEWQRQVKHGKVPLAAGLLTGRELEVLRLMADGLSNPQIARRLVISLDTAKTHVHHVLEKLEAASRVQAIARARDLDLL
jgi:LuxR family maltose regulon positive regulatory protein